MIAAKVHSLTPFFVVYKQEALILARSMAVDMIFFYSWDYFCLDERVYTEELVMMFAGQKPKVAKMLKRAGEK